RNPNLLKASKRVLARPESDLCVAFLANRGELEDLPLIAATLLLEQQPACEVIVMPAGLDQDDRALELGGTPSLDVPLKITPEPVIVEDLAVVDIAFEAAGGPGGVPGPTLLAPRPPPDL